jgi:hypothetical protein
MRPIDPGASIEADIGELIAAVEAWRVRWDLDRDIVPVSVIAGIWR